MHPFFAVFRIQCVELSVTWFVLGIYIYEKLRIHENTREFARLYEEGGRTGILRRLSLDEPSLAVLTSPSQKQTDRCHPLEARPFTIRENARCQSFPDEWQFCGSVSSQYKQVGNAVPVNLAFDIAKQIKTALEGL